MVASSTSQSVEYIIKLRSNIARLNIHSLNCLTSPSNYTLFTSAKIENVIGNQIEFRVVNEEETYSWKGTTLSGMLHLE